MNRRTFLSLSSFAAQATAQDVARRTESGSRFIGKKTGAHPFKVKPGARRPHIFLISADMVSPDHYHPSRALHRSMNLPALRSLQRDSVSFTNAFSVSPLCAPARAALATGRYPYITANGERAHDGHETILRTSDVIFQEYLKATGYATKHAGKGHLGTQKYMDAFDENDSAWDRWAPPIQDDELYQFYLRHQGVKPQRYRKEITGLQQDRKSSYVSLGGWIEQEDGRPFPLEAQYSQYLAERAIQKLDTAIASGQRIYQQLDFFDPHQPFSIPDGLAAREKDLRAAFELPESYRHVLARDWKAIPEEPKVYDFYRKCWGLYEAETLRDYRVANALQMEIVDRALGKFLDALRQRGLYDDSLIIFTSDHGEMNGRRGLVDKGVYLFPDVLRVPLFVKMPGRGGAGRTEDAPVSHLDLAPTILDLAGVESAERLDGVSLLPILEGRQRGGDRELLFECGWHTGVNFACAFQHWDPRAGHYLYSYNLSSNVDELYDLASPDAVNLAKSDPRIHKDMVERLGAFLERDPRWIGYWHSFRVDLYDVLPKRKMGDTQMFRPV